MTDTPTMVPDLTKADLILHLGVLVQPYRFGRKGLTTADVAMILEAHYGVMTAFVTTHEKDIAKALEGSLQGALETLLMRGKVGAAEASLMAGNAANQALQDIQKAFNDFISTGEAERVGIPGTPTKAALMGINHRFKHPHTGIRRPSFKDTGLYMGSMRAWMT